MFIGTYTNTEPHARGRAEGIHVLRFDPSTGELSPATIAAGVVNPSFVALSPDRRTLYAVNEVPEIDGHAGGAVSAFAVDQTAGALQFLNRQSSGGADPAHVSVDASGLAVLVANYGDGTVAAFAAQVDGRLSPPSSVHQHRGSGPNRDRQEGPHAHQIVPDPSNRFALATDLGTDQVVLYRLDTNRSAIRSIGPAAVLHPGAGPRHLAFHPNGRFVYVINELDSTMTAFSWDERAGSLTPVQTVSTLPAGYTGSNSCADVHVAPSGHFVYGSNRGHDTIVTFAVDPDSGELSCVNHLSTQGKTPRSFAIAPDGRFLLVANQDSDTIVTLRLEPGTGIPMPTGSVIDVPSPVCVMIDAGS